MAGVLLAKSVFSLKMSGEAYLVCKLLDWWHNPTIRFTVQKYIAPSVSKAHAGYFHVSVIHLTLTWATGSLTCVRGHSYACVYTQGLGTLLSSQHFWHRNFLIFSCVPAGVRTLDLRILSPTIYQFGNWATPSPLHNTQKLIILDHSAMIQNGNFHWGQ